MQATKLHGLETYRRNIEINADDGLDREAVHLHVEVDFFSSYKSKGLNLEFPRTMSYQIHHVSVSVVIGTALMSNPPPSVLHVLPSARKPRRRIGSTINLLPSSTATHLHSSPYDSCSPRCSSGTPPRASGKSPPETLQTRNTGSRGGTEQCARLECRHLAAESRPPHLGTRQQQPSTPRTMDRT